MYENRHLASVRYNMWATWKMRDIQAITIARMVAQMWCKQFWLRVLPTKP